MTQLELYKSFQFMAELLIAEFIFTFRMPRRSHFPLRITLGVIACFVFSYLFPVAFDNAFFFSFMFLSIFTFTVIIGAFCFKCPVINTMFCCIAGYTVQHMSYELFSLIQLLLNVSSETGMGMYGNSYGGIFSNPLIAILYFYIYIMIYFFAFFFFGRKIERYEQMKIKNVYIFIFVVFILLVDIILNAVVVYFAGEGTELFVIIARIYNILCCFFALFLQFEVSLRRKLEVTLETVQQLWHKEKAQYAASKENIQLINLKCHDLKHQIRKIGSSVTLDQSTVKGIEDLVSIYDSTVKTDNVALDIILTEKSLLCQKNGIQLSCIVEGEKLSFMKEEDIYSLFGNILDNAIEAVLELENEQRVIGLKVKAVGKLLTINTHNYFKSDLVFKDGIPQTTKAEKDFHGFGMRSIQYVCDKYDGNLSISTKKHVFSLNILFNLKA